VKRLKVTSTEVGSLSNAQKGVIQETSQPAANAATEAPSTNHKAFILKPDLFQSSKTGVADNPTKPVKDPLPGPYNRLLYLQKRRMDRDERVTTSPKAKGVGGEHADEGPQTIEAEKPRSREREKSVEPRAQLSDRK
jgi:hypothetical protein